MFKKLLSNLPFNPSLIGQVAFYGKRLHKEEAVRRAGFVFMALTMLIQVLAVMSPASAQLQKSYSNDIIVGGPKSKFQILLNVLDTNKDVAAIYAYFGIDGKALSDLCGGAQDCAPEKDAIVSTAANDYWSIGRHDVNSYRDNAYAKQDYLLTIAGAKTPVHARPLHAWDTGTSTNYAGWKGTNKWGQTFWIMADCGNVTTKGPFTPPNPPKPDVKINKTRTSAATVKAGDAVSFSLQYKNAVTNSVAHNFSVVDTIDQNFDFVSSSTGQGESYDPATRTLKVTRNGELPYSADFAEFILNVKVKGGTKSGTKICNVASGTSDESKPAPLSPTDDKCVVVFNPCTFAGKEAIPIDDGSGRCFEECKPGIALGDAKCFDAPNAACTAITTAVDAAKKKVKIDTTVTASNSVTQVTYYRYDADGKQGKKKVSTSLRDTEEMVFTAAGQHRVEVVVGLTNSKESKETTCSTSFESAPDASISKLKSVSNTTQKKDDANGTTANGGDTLEFKITAKNTTAGIQENYEFVDFIGDVLDYADIISVTDGVKPDANGYMKWPVQTIGANASVTKVITVKVKDPIPTTNTPNGDKTRYDLQMSNTYGNEVVVKVPAPFVKRTEGAVTSLPNTGPGTSLMIGFAVTAVIAYFFSRSRLLANEIDIVKHEYTMSGGL